jgi:rare lipoprotein A
MITSLLNVFKKPLQLPLVVLGLMVPCLMGAGTAHAVPANTPDLKPSAENMKRHWYQVGHCSWYGRQFQGQKTASGESFDMNAMTAAHRTLPLGSWVRVTNLRNRKMVVVKINDRGPVPQDRVLDLSQAAARMLGVSGTGSVKVELLKDVAGTMMAQLRPPTLLAGH